MRFHEFISACDYDVATKVKRKIETALADVEMSGLPILSSAFGPVPFAEFIGWLEKVSPNGPLMMIAIAGVKSYAAVADFANAGTGSRSFEMHRYGSMSIPMDQPFGVEPTTRINTTAVQTSCGNFDLIINQADKSSEKLVLFGLTMESANEPILIPLGMVLNMDRITLGIQ